MKTTLIFVALFGLCLAFPSKKDPTEKEFEEEFHKAYLSKEDEAKAEENLKKAEAAIDEENEKFAKGEANFEEQLEPWDDLSPEEFEKEMTGALPEEGRGLGIIYDPSTMFNTAEDQATLDEFYARFDMERGALPASFDSRVYGN